MARHTGHLRTEHLSRLRLLAPRDANLGVESCKSLNGKVLDMKMTISGISKKLISLSPFAQPVVF